MRRGIEPAAVAGFVAAEGSFTQKSVSAFRFSVALGARDAATCDALRSFFDVGRVYWYRRRKEHYDDETVFTVQALASLVEVIVPFMDQHLPPCHKRTQYDAWRRALLDYWEHRARRPRPCTVAGCEQPRRAKGVCRRHYYAAYGR